MGGRGVYARSIWDGGVAECKVTSARSDVVLGSRRSRKARLGLERPSRLTPVDLEPRNFPGRSTLGLRSSA
jgi:hypothetical protein